MVAKKNENMLTNKSTKIVEMKLAGCEDGAHEGLHERRLGAHQEDADGDQHGDVGQQRDAVRPGDADVVIGQEHDLDVEQQHDGQHDQRQPRHAVQEHAHDAAAVGPGDGLHEKEVVELEPQRMRALVGGFEKAHGVSRTRASREPAA